MMPLTDKQKMIMTLRFLADPRGEFKLKQDILDNLAGCKDRRSFQVAKYIADPDGNANVKRAIFTIMELSPEELALCIRLVNG